MSSTSIDSTFQSLLQALKQRAQDSAQKLRQSGALGWDDYSSGSGGSGSTAGAAPPYFQPQAVNTAFEPTDANQLYAKATAAEDADSAYTKNVVAAKLQVNLMGQLKRDFKSRRMTRIQMLAVEVSRRDRQGSAAGAITSDLIGAPQLILRAQD